ncbi:MAG: 6,7-dimethyl-8-ribityllumazine synthase [bacterium]|nr:6,7-dimethyl-8-ribityllumazine synthase [bacterium]
MIRKKVKEQKISGDWGSVRVGVIVATFNSDITDNLLKGAIQELEDAGVMNENIKVLRVPGSLEIPLACKFLAKAKYDCLVALGCVIKGETDHYYYVSGESYRKVMDISIEYSTAIGFGIITADNLKQAKARSSDKYNIGRHAAKASLEMARIKEEGKY